MAERHDILLVLNLDEFKKNIAQARVLLESLTKVAQDVSKQISTSLGNAIGGANAQIVAASKTVGTQASGALAQGFSQGAGTLQKTTQAAIQKVGPAAAGTAQTIGQTLGNITANDFSKAFSTGLRFGFSFAIGNLFSGANVANALREITRNIARSFTNLGFDKAILPQINQVSQTVGSSLANIFAGVKTQTTQVAQAVQTAGATIQGVFAGTRAQATQAASGIAGVFGATRTAAQQATAALQQAQGVFQGTAAAAATFAATGVPAATALGQVGQQAGQTGQQVSTLGAFLNSTNIILGIVGASALILGNILDKLGSSVLSLSNKLAEASGAFTLTFARLDSVIKASEANTGRALGTIGEFRSAIVQISTLTGQSVEELSNLSTVFISIDRTGALAKNSLLGLVEAAAFLRPLFRNQIEQLTNIRNALQGNFRAINQNIFVARDQADADRIFIELQQAKGKTLEESEKILRSTNVLERNSQVILKAATPIIEGTINATDSLTRANLKLATSLEVFEAALGKSSETLTAKFKFALADVLTTLSKIDPTILNTIGTIITLGGAAISVTASILKIVGAISLLVLGARLLTAVLTTTALTGFFGGATLGGAIAGWLGLNTAIKTTTGLLGALTVASTLFLAKWAAITLAISLAIAVAKKFVDAFSGVDQVNTQLEATGTAAGVVGEQFGIASKGVELFQTAVLTLFLPLSRIALLLVSAARAVVEFNRANGLVKFSADSLDRLQKVEAELKTAVELGSAAFKDQVNSITGAKDALTKYLNAVEEFDKEMGQSRKNFDILNTLSDDQKKIVDQLIDKTKDEVTQLRIRNAELSAPNKASAEQAKLNILIDETIKKAKIEGGTADLVAAAIKEKVKAELGMATSLRASNQALEEQQSFLQSLLTSALNLKKAFDTENRQLKEGVASATALRDALLSGSEETIKNAEREAATRKIILDTDQKLATLREELAAKTIIKEGREIVVPVSLAKRKEVEAQIDKLTKERDLNINLKLKELDLAEVNKVLNDIQDSTGKLIDSFRNTKRSIDQDNEGMALFLQNLGKGITFAEQQDELRRKDIERLNQINDLTARLSDASQVLSEADRANLTHKRDILLQEKDRLAVLDKQNQSMRLQVEAAKALADINQSIADQIKLLEKRKALFDAGVITDSIDTTKEKIDILTSALQKLLEEEIKLSKQDPTNPATQTQLEAIRLKIEEVKGALLDEQFAKNVEAVFTSITGALEDAINEGVRGVLQGTQTIEGLFRSMAQNILLALQKLAVNKFIEITTNQLKDLAAQFAKIPLVRDIAAKLGIKLGTGKTPTTSQEDLLKAQQVLLEDQKNQDLAKELNLNTEKTVLERFSQVIEQFRSAIEQLQAKLGVGTGTTPATTPVPGTTAAPIGVAPANVTTIQQPPGDPVPVLITNPAITETDLSDAATDIGSSVEKGLQSVGIEVERETKNVLDAVKKTGQEVIQSVEIQATRIMGLITDITNAQTQSEMFKNLGSLFMGAAAAAGGGSKQTGGLVTGRSKRPDSLPTMLTDKEFVVRPEAVKFFGVDFFKKLNALETPMGMATSVPKPVADNRPIIINMFDRSPKLDPAAFRMSPEEVMTITVEGYRRDKVLRRTIKEDQNR